MKRQRATPVVITHFSMDADTSGFFPQLAKLHDRSLYRMIFATLRPMDPRLSACMEEAGVERFSCEARSRWLYPFAIMKLATFLRRNHVQVFHAHLFESSVIGLLAAWLARTPIRILTRHYSDYHTRIDKHLHVLLDRMCTALSHRVIAVSQHTADHLLTKENAPRSKVRVVLNGIDFQRVRTPSTDERQRIRREFLPEGGYLLVVVARLHAEKGHSYLFRALAELASRVPNPVKLLVAGTGPSDAAYREEVRALGLDSVVQFVGFRDDSSALMAAADLVILPSVAEAFGLVLTESLYVGTPIVATRVGGIPEIVDDQVDGVLVPPADVRALADAITALLVDGNRREQMAGKGREKVARRFRFDDMLRQYEGIYGELLQ